MLPGWPGREQWPSEWQMSPCRQSPAPWSSYKSQNRPTIAIVTAAESLHAVLAAVTACGCCIPYDSGMTGVILAAMTLMYVVYNDEDKQHT